MRGQTELGGAWLDDDPTNAERPAVGAGAGYVLELQADNTLKFRALANLGGHWEPVANGDSATPEIVFSDGDVVMTWVED